VPAGPAPCRQCRAAQPTGHRNRFSTSYAALHRYVRRPGLESDYHLLTPMEFHADTTELIQRLSPPDPHVALDPVALDRLITWIDLNAPFHGRWTDIAGPERVEPWAARRRALARSFGNVEADLEALPPAPPCSAEPAIPPGRSDRPAPPLRSRDWPFDERAARERQEKHGTFQRSIELGGGIEVSFVWIPGGEFPMGDPHGGSAAHPQAVVRVSPFWMGQFEVTNEQYAQFDPAHDSKVESRHAMQFGVRGWSVNGSKQPVVRVAWSQAMAFCRWLSAKTGYRVTLPTEAQWEYACRAGSDASFFFGELGTDFSRHANLADATLSEFVAHPYRKERDPYPNPGVYDDWIPKESRFRDGGFVSEDVGRYLPNPWGLHDMHGNVAEWTRSLDRPYPYADHDGGDTVASAERRVVRGGSWRDRPFRATAAFRLGYWPHQPVFNVGFRVVMEEEREHDALSGCTASPDAELTPSQLARLLSDQKPQPPEQPEP